MKKLGVVALGGNALLMSNQEGTIDEQQVMLKQGLYQ